MYMRKVVVSPRQYSQMKRLKQEDLSVDKYMIKLNGILGNHLVEELIYQVTEVSIDFNADKNPQFKAYLTEDSN